jgi:hypothetical protein
MAQLSPHGGMTFPSRGTATASLKLIATSPMTRCLPFKLDEFFILQIERVESHDQGTDTGELDRMGIEH